MPTKPTDLRPIQVFLDTSGFISTPDPVPFPRATKDFFEGNNNGFAEHKKSISARIVNMAKSMRIATPSGGFIKVRQREQAIAKSHRPLNALFSRGNEFSFVGAERIGELLFQATPGALEHLADVISLKAELIPQNKLDKRTGTLEPRVSIHRSELGGIDDIQLYSASDRLKFSASDAIEWMEQSSVIGGYVVELFRPDGSSEITSTRRMIRDLSNALMSVQGGVLVRPILPSSPTAGFGRPSLALSVQLTRGRSRQIDLPFDLHGNALEVYEQGLPDDFVDMEPDLRVARHADLLSVLAEQALVRSIELPPTLETTPPSTGSNYGVAVISTPDSGVDYPIVGIVDGGVCDSVLQSWKVDEAGLVPNADRDESHGTFIAGLISLGSSLNPGLGTSVESVGCKVYDIDLFPRRDLRRSYYKDIEELFDVLDEKIKVAKRDFSVRVFNLSFSIGSRSSRLAYSLSADRLDRIARSNDVIFVVAAGNLLGASARSPWPQRASDAATMLAAYTADNQQITAPSEHLLGLTVGAVNPPGTLPHVPMVPTTYTRRGPGVGGARKPDLCHFGGTESTKSSGLISLSTDGSAICNRGTSFATPLAAATLATLDQRLARQAEREILLALPVHRAVRSEFLKGRPLRHVAHEFVGFGLPPTADDLLHDDPHSVTLVFSEKLLARQRLEFSFSWPRALVGKEGKCRGRADVTLCYTPPIDPDHREEAMRVSLEAALQQEEVAPDTGEISWKGQLAHDAADAARGPNKSEMSLIKTGLKWSPIKRYGATMPRGRGASSNWRLTVESLVRGGASYPEAGVPFALLLTITDMDGESAVREDVRFSLQQLGVSLADITLAHRVRRRIG